MSDKPKLPSQAQELSDEPQDGASTDVPDWLGSQLRDLYADVMNEPMPEKFRDLLKQLEEKDGK